MASHPTDSLGRTLPHPGWPSQRSAPGELELVRRFCNTINRENGADWLTDTAGVDAWLESEGRPPLRVNDDELVLLREFREALHQLTIANVEGGSPADWGRIGDLASKVVFDVSRTRPAIRPVGTTPVLAFVGELVAIVVDAYRTGDWARLKPCDHCRWTVYDASKNQSSRWCSVKACGGRQHARDYRARRRSDG